MNHNMLIGIIIIAVLILAGVCVYYTRKSNEPITTSALSVKNSLKKTKAESKVLSGIEEKLTKLRDNLNTVVHKNISGDKQNIENIFRSTMKIKPGDVVKSLSSSDMLVDFSLDGETIQEPIMRMYSKNPHLFIAIGNSGLLEFLGKVIAISNWTQNGRNKSTTGFENIIKCLDTVNWRDIDIWKNISDSNGVVQHCII
jgi:hypothetical protein